MRNYPMGEAESSWRERNRHGAMRQEMKRERVRCNSKILSSLVYQRGKQEPVNRAMDETPVWIGSLSEWIVETLARRGASS
jgi:hypothetical protein